MIEDNKLTNRLSWKESPLVEAVGALRQKILLVQHFTQTHQVVLLFLCTQRNFADKSSQSTFEGFQSFGQHFAEETVNAVRLVLVCLLF